jgi:hypothetical protein
VEDQELRGRFRLPVESGGSYKASAGSAERVPKLFGH